MILEAVLFISGRFKRHEAVTKFLENNNLLSIIRAHEAQFEGFKAYIWQKSVFPQVITLFSAPNYCGTYANKGAVMRLRNNEMQVLQYNFSPKPDGLSQLGDAFVWSVPLINRALTDMLIGFLEFTNDAVYGESGKEQTGLLDEGVLRALQLKRKDGWFKSGRERKTREEFYRKTY